MSRKLSRIDLVSLIYNLSKMKFQDSQLLTHLVEEVGSRHLQFLNYIELRILVLGIVAIRDKAVKQQFFSNIFDPFGGLLKDIQILDQLKVSKLSCEISEIEKQISQKNSKESIPEVMQHESGLISTHPPLDTDQSM